MRQRQLVCLPRRMVAQRNGQHLRVIIALPRCAVEKLALAACGCLC